MNLGYHGFYVQNLQVIYELVKLDFWFVLVLCGLLQLDSYMDM